MSQYRSRGQDRGIHLWRQIQEHTPPYKIWRDALAVEQCQRARTVEYEVWKERLVIGRSKARSWAQVEGNRPVKDVRRRQLVGQLPAYARPCHSLSRVLPSHRQNNAEYEALRNNAHHDARKRHIGIQLYIAPSSDNALVLH